MQIMTKKYLLMPPELTELHQCLWGYEKTLSHMRSLISSWRNKKLERLAMHQKSLDKLLKIKKSQAILRIRNRRPKLLGWSCLGRSWFFCEIAKWSLVQCQICPRRQAKWNKVWNISSIASLVVDLQHFWKIIS